MYKKGDVVFLKLEEESIGHEQYGTRPCVILANFPNHNLALVAPTTKTVRPSPPRVSVKAGQGGLSVDSDILLHQLRTVDYSRFGDKLGTLRADVMDRVDIVLQDILDV